MRCRKHPTDFSSAIGVCASCLRERLFAIIAAQAQAQAQKQVQQEFRKFETQQQYPLPFPSSVSPYISRRKSDITADTSTGQNGHQRFYSTPQAGFTGSLTVEVKKSGRKSKVGRISSLLLGLFRSKPRKSDLDSGPISDPGAPIDSYRDSPSWFSTIVPGGRNKQQMRTFSLDERIAMGAQRIVCRNRDRGMSPARYSNADDDEHCHRGSSGYSSESSQGCKHTPRRTPAAMRRGGWKAAAVGNSRNLSTFCLSPLVRPSPNRHWSQKCTQPEISNAPSFCKNRSRKLANIGRYNHNTIY